MLRVYLFQCLQALAEDGEILDLGSPTVRSLFAYLIMSRGRPQDRRRMAFLFWPRATESAARRNLRQYIHHLRRLLEPAGLADTFLDAEGSTLQINPGIDLWVDVEEFRRLAHPDAELDDLSQAAQLYGGPLLEEIYDDWIVDDRQRLHQMYLDVLDRLSLAYQAAGRLSDAIQTSQRWVGVEAFDERGHRRLMSLYALAGDRNRALQHFQTLQRDLDAELGAEPTPETIALYHSLQGKGQKAEPAAYANGHAAAEGQKTAEVPASPVLPIVGRQAELAKMQVAGDEARVGHGSLLLVTGESGIGKTRLVQEALAQHKGKAILQTACHELEAVIPYAAMRPLVQQAVDLMPESFWQPVQPWMVSLAVFSPALAARYPYLVLGSLTAARSAEASAAASETQQVGFALVQLLERICEQLPVVLEDSPSLLVILDDLHWADSLVWDLLAQISRLAVQTRLLVIGVCRHEDLSPERSRALRQLSNHNLIVELPLARLSLEETTILAAQVYPQHVSDDFFFHRLHQETGGNPFFIIEMLHALREAGMESAGSTKIDGQSRQTIQRMPDDAFFLNREMPLSIQRLVEARLDRLSQPSHELLSATAAIGQAFSLGMLESIVDEPPQDVVAAIEEWLRRRLVVETSGGYDFSHDKIRQAAYTRLSRARREFIHRRIAESLENSLLPLDAATLAHHYSRSDQPFRALPFLARAGEQALSVRSYSEARLIGQQALNLLGRVPGPQQQPERIDLSLQLAQAHAYTGELGRAAELLRQAEGLCLSLNDTPRLVQICYRSAQVAWLRGLPEQAGDFARRMQRLAVEQENKTLQLAALRMLGRVGIATSNFDDAIAYLNEYVQRNSETQALPDLPIVLGYLSVALARVGSWERAYEIAGQALTLAEEGVTEDTRRFSLMQNAFIHAAAGHWEDAWQILTNKLVDNDSESAESGFTPLRFILIGLRGRVMAQLGKAEDGAALVQQALSVQSRGEYRVFGYLPRLYLAEALILSGKFAAAQDAAIAGIEQARQAGDRWAQGVGLRLQAETLWRSANPSWPRIEDCLIESLNLLRSVRGRPDLARTYLALRRLYDRAGQIAWAVDCHFRAISIYDELGMQSELRQAQGAAATTISGAVVISGMELRGPNTTN